MESQENNVQKFTTLLGFSLPLLQFFYGLLSNNIASIFLFKDYFLVVSVFTVVISYIMVLVLKSDPWFDWAPFQKKRKQKLTKWLTFTNPDYFSGNEIAEYVKANKVPRQLRSIKSANISQKMFLPFIVITFVVFYALGLRFGIMQSFSLNGTEDVALSTIQALAYSIFVTTVVLAFALQYLRDNNQKKFRDSRIAQFNKVIELCRKQNAFQEYKSVSLKGYKLLKNSEGNATQQSYLVKLGDDYYIIVCDLDVDMINLVIPFEDEKDATDQFWGV